MDDDTASRFVSSLVKSIQALCNGYIDFSSSIEVVGHIHLNIDRNVKLDYVLTEEVSKSLSEGSTVFASHSYHSKPLSNLSKSSGDHSNRNKKSQQNNDTDPLGIGSLPPEVPNATRSESHSRTANRVCDSGDSSLSGSQDFDSVKQENRSSCQVRDSFEKRRRSGPGRRSPSPVAKRGRSNDTNSGVDVIEIKEEPDDEPSVFFGNSAGGADIQTPDFSNVVMESLDRVGQAEGASLVAGDVMQMNKQQPFPVMLHSNMPSTSSSVTGQSDPRASTSGEELSGIRSRLHPFDLTSAVNAMTQRYNPMLMAPQLQHTAFSAVALQRQVWMNSNLVNYRPRPRLQYSQNQIEAAIHDVRAGKSISKSAKDHGVPFTSLYRKIKVKPRSPSPLSTHRFDDDDAENVVQDSGMQNPLHSNIEEIPISFDAEYSSLQAPDFNSDDKTFLKHLGSTENQSQVQGGHGDDLVKGASAVDHCQSKEEASMGHDTSCTSLDHTEHEAEESFFPDMSPSGSLNL